MPKLKMLVAVGLTGLVAGLDGIGQVLGTVDTTPIMLAEINSPIAGRLFRLQTEAYEAQKQSLILRVNALLLKSESERRGISPDELLNAEAYSRVPELSEAELEAAVAASQVPLATEALRQMITGKRRVLARKSLERSLWRSREPGLDFRPPRWPERLDVANGPRLGVPDAKLRIVVFSDFECVYCAQLATGLRSMVEKSADTSVSFRHFPLESHSAASSAAQFAACAQQKGKFWPLHDRLFQRSNRLTIDNIREAWKLAGLLESEFVQCFEDVGAKQSVREDVALARRLDLRGTPSVFVNERLVLTGGNLDMLADLIFEERNHLFSKLGAER